jgi:hypothetical protein
MIQDLGGGCDSTTGTISWQRWQYILIGAVGA